MSIEALSKSYLVGQRTAGDAAYATIRESLSNYVRQACRNLRDVVTGNQIVHGDRVEEFWALKDVTFAVQESEVVGLIGKNGAGKSTLLKVLSRITEPTKGRVRLRGRVASLLEVGTGFHPELTGRENIFLNGAILGMSRREVRAKFDEIVEFAGVSMFLETPVKRYSSGMYVRLAFAVAAHLEPEILVVDEVLAVGDLEFQRKCLGKMSEVASGGRTVLFVSHNMAAIERLCSRVVYLRDGQVRFDGPPADAIAAYVSVVANSARSLPPTAEREGNGLARITELRNPSTIRSGDPFEVTVRFNASEGIRRPDLRISIYSSSGHCIAHFGTSYTDTPLPATLGSASATLSIPTLPLNVGHYTVNVSLSEPGCASDTIVDRIRDATVFQVIAADPFGTGKSPRIGSIFFDHTWSYESAPLTRLKTGSPT